MSPWHLQLQLRPPSPPFPHKDLVSLSVRQPLLLQLDSLWIFSLPLPLLLQLSPAIPRQEVPTVFQRLCQPLPRPLQPSHTPPTTQFCRCTVAVAEQVRLVVPGTVS